MNHTHNEDQSKHLPGWCSVCTVYWEVTAWAPHGAGPGGLNSRHKGGLHIVDTVPTHTQDCDRSSGDCTDPPSPRTGAHPSSLSTVDTRVYRVYTAQPLSATTPPLMHLIDTLGNLGVTSTKECTAAAGSSRGRPGPRHTHYITNATHNS